MKYHVLFVIFEKPTEFEIVISCKLEVALYGLKTFCKCIQNSVKVAVLVTSTYISRTNRQEMSEIKE